MSIPFTSTAGRAGLGMLIIALASCTSPQAECDQLRGALDEGSNRLQAIYEGNRGGSGFTQGVERQIARIYFDTAQVVDSVSVSDRQLQNIQFQLVEAYQLASDYRYQAAEIMAAPPDTVPERNTQVRELQLESDSTIAAASSALDRRCPV